MGSLDYMLPWSQQAGQVALDEAAAYDEATSDSTRMYALKTFAEAMAGSARKGTITDGEGFVRVARQAARSVSTLSEVSGGSGTLRLRVMMHDLKRVLIGDGWTSKERNTGKFALQFQAFLDTGFKPEFRDRSNQVQHAMAGIYLGWGFPSWPTVWFVKRQEDGAADLRLYDATFPIGRTLRRGDNYARLPDLIKDELLA
jgi:hypothetical protein